MEPSPLRTLELDISPDISQTVPGDADVGPEVPEPDLLHPEHHALCVRVLVDVHDGDLAARGDALLLPVGPELHPVVDGPRGGLNLSHHGVN